MGAFSKRNNSSKKNNVQLPSWACLVAPQKLVVPSSSNAQWLAKTKKKKSQPRRSNNSSDETREAAELEFQQNYARTRLYHLWSRQLDRLVHDFVTTTTKTEPNRCDNAAAKLAAPTATVKEDLPASHKKRRLSPSKDPGVSDDANPSVDTTTTKEASASSWDDLYEQALRQHEREEQLFQSFAQRFQVPEELQPQPQQKRRHGDPFSDSRMVLPVTIWPQTNPLCNQLSYQHELDRFMWMQTYVRHQQHQQSSSVVVWLQKPQQQQQDMLDWPKEEIIRQLYLRYNVQRLVRFSRSTWARMTLSELLVTWARHALALLVGDDNNKNSNEQQQPTITIVWDAQSCRFHPQFWEWLVEQRCRHGVPLRVTLLQDAAETLLGQTQRTIPPSCAAQIHVNRQERMTIRNTAQQQQHRSLSSWTEQMLVFGMQQCGVDGAIHQDQRQALKVVLQWLWWKLPKKKNDDERQELVPVLLQWKKELAWDLARADLSSDNEWSLLCHDLTRLGPSVSGTWTDLCRRIRLINLLRCSTGEQPNKSNPLERYKQHFQTFCEIERGSQMAWTALRLQYSIVSKQGPAFFDNPTTPWTMEDRTHALQDLLKERQAFTSADSETAPFLDCINEWMVLVGHVANCNDYVKCLDEQIHRLLYCMSGNESQDSLKVRQNTVAGLQWEKHHAELPYALVSSLTNDATNTESRRRVIACWALRVAPAVLYNTLLTQVSVGRLDWYRILYQRIQQTLLIEMDGGEEDPSEDLLGHLPQVFQCTLYHLRIMGLIKEQRRNNETSYEKVALVFCSGD